MVTTTESPKKEPLKIHEEFYDGKLFMTTSRDDFVVQVYQTYGTDVFIMNAFTPWDLNEMYPGAEKVSRFEMRNSYEYLEAPEPLFGLGNVCTYKGKMVGIRSRFFDFREEYGWKYIIAPCRDQAGVAICQENDLSFHETIYDHRE